MGTFFWHKVRVSQPDVLPAFLVCRDGWIVDWFPAPPVEGGNTPETVTDPLGLLALVEARLSAYGR